MYVGYNRVKVQREVCVCVCVCARDSGFTSVVEYKFRPYKRERERRLDFAFLDA